MNEFSFGGAWTKGVGALSGTALSHAMILLGVGVLLPILLQLLVAGPAAMAGTAAPGGAAGPASGAATLTGFVLQTGSFFASWRLVLGRGETLRGALLYGMLAGLAVCVGFFIVLLVVGLLLSVSLGMIAMPVAVIGIVVAMLGLLAIAWTTYAALFAVAICLFFLLSLGIGAAMGDLTYAATIVGGGGYVWTFLVAAALLLLWLAGRLSCTTVLMAERKSFNLVGAMRESWSLTWDDEWRIMRYLALVGLAMAFAMVIVAAAAGAGLALSLQAQGEQLAGIVRAIILPLVSLPLVYLSVMVPAGIYRELSPADAAAAEVFA